jgi:ribosome-binding protein aMBF1 (putative translation factor)
VPKPKPSTISRDPYSEDPYAFIGSPTKKEPSAAAKPSPQESEPISKPAPETQAAKKLATEKISTLYPVELIERARDAAYWDRDTLAGIIVQALSDALDRKEKERGESYPPRKGELRSGRPVGTGKAK